MLEKKICDLEHMDEIIKKHLDTVTAGIHHLEEDIKHKAVLQADFERLEEYLLEHSSAAGTAFMLQSELGYLSSAILNS